MLDSNGKAMVMAAFLADTLALGAHWIYDTDVISRRYGRIEDLLKPEADSYHPTKSRGEFTHYGDQMLVLLESVAAKGAFDLKDFSERWKSLFDKYDGYVDQATKGTLSGFAIGKSPEKAGSTSDDLAGASRIAPLVYCYRADREGLIEACKAQTQMTHNSMSTVSSAEFFAGAAWMVLDGARPTEAVEKILTDWTGDPRITQWAEAGLASREEESIPAIARFGQSCHTPDAFPGVIHLIARYEDDLREALIQSVMAGGDSAARGMMAATTLGAHLGPKGLPQDWLADLKKREEIRALLDRIP